MKTLFFKSKSGNIFNMIIGEAKWHTQLKLNVSKYAWWNRDCNEKNDTGQKMGQ